MSAPPVREGKNEQFARQDPPGGGSAGSHSSACRRRRDAERLQYHSRFRQGRVGNRSGGLERRQQGEARDVSRRRQCPAETPEFANRRGACNRSVPDALNPCFAEARGIMTGLTKFSGAILTAALLLGPPAIASAQVSFDVTIAPPPPRAEPPPPPRPGYVWAPGYWGYRQYRYDWVPGRWVPNRPGYRWVQDTWVQRGPRWHYVPGHWVR